MGSAILPGGGTVTIEDLLFTVAFAILMVVWWRVKKMEDDRE